VLAVDVTVVDAGWFEPFSAQASSAKPMNP
jgi:hypothetical protein